MSLNINKSDQTSQVIYTIPAQGNITGTNTVTVQKTSDGSLQVNMVFDASFGAENWSTYCNNLEIDNVITAV